MASIDTFLSAPSRSLLGEFTKEQLFELARHYEVTISKSASRVKETVISALVDDLVRKNVLLPDVEEDKQDDPCISGSQLSFEERKQLLELQIERERLGVERERLSTERERWRLEALRLEHIAVEEPVRFNVQEYRKLIPQFSESDVETFFTLFDHLAASSGWSDEHCVLLLQSVLTGKALKAYAALRVSSANLKYAQVRAAVLQAYEQTPETYRERFRNGKKKPGQTHLEYTRELTDLFNCWCTSLKVDTLEKLRDLMVVDQLRNSVSKRLSTFLGDRGVTDPLEAAALADDYLINHKHDSVFDYGSRAKEHFRRDDDQKSQKLSGHVRWQKSNPDWVCHLCKEKGHFKWACPKRKDVKSGQAPVRRASVSPKQSPHSTAICSKPVAPSGAFMMRGSVSLAQQEKSVPVRILRDSGADVSLISDKVLPFSADSGTGDSVLIVGIGLHTITAPLHTVHLDSELVKGEVLMGVVSGIPGKDGCEVDILLGNDLAGLAMYPGVPPPIVMDLPLVAEDGDGSLSFPDVFTACAVTRARSRSEKDFDEASPVTPELGVKLSDLPVSLSRKELVDAQTEDETLTELFAAVVSGSDINSMTQGYFLQEGMLLRKSVSHIEPFLGEPVAQVVVPQTFRNKVLRVAHDDSGHTGVRKTYDRIIRAFYWPKLKRDVASYIRTCHTCQITGKPNQSLKPAPLHPIPAIGQPFDHLIIDCVGPLPRSKNGSNYLLTVMCQNTRYPAAYPLRTITARSIVKALSQFMSYFGIPKVIQSDQGSNFTSHLFSQVLKQLRVKHIQASAYHPQSQGALERFHQTLKSLLRAYCVEVGGDWEEGLPWVLLAAREVVQESTGFSPNDLVMGHTVRGPVAAMRDRWEVEKPPQNLFDYINGFRQRLYSAGMLAQQKLTEMQSKMKKLYDRRSEVRQFAPGDQVLALLPVVGSPFQAKFSGPHKIVRKVSDTNYIVSTPHRRRSTQLCHVNLLKPYFERAEPEKIVLPCMVAVDYQEGVEPPDDCILQGRLKNSETLKTLEETLGHLTKARRTELAELIRSYPTIFGDAPTQTHLIEHDIDVGDALPIRQRFYRVSYDKRQMLDKEVDYMLKHGIAKNSASSWASPCLLVGKPDGTQRFCTDYRKVNSVTKPDSFPLPRMEDCIDQVGSAKFVSKFDLLKGYWQVPLTKRAQEISAFITPSGLYSYSVMSFGLRNAPATFQRLMNRVIAPLEGCAVYLDDVVIHSDTWENHIERIRALFDRLTWAGLTINLAKCEFARATVTYLGKVVGHGHIRPVRAKVEAIDSFPVPTTKKELMRFLGLVGYYRGFCRNFSTVVVPLTNLLKGKTDFVWSPACQSAFNNVRSLLCSAPVLVAPRLDRPFSLQVDASQVGAGAVLLQEDDQKIERPISFFSRKFNPHQLNYSTIEKEALALIWALKHFEVYVGSTRPLVVYTDHNPLTFLNSMSCPNQRLMRWCLFLQGFPLDVRHIKGRDNVVADALSRAPCSVT